MGYLEFLIQFYLKNHARVVKLSYLNFESSSGLGGRARSSRKGDVGNKERLQRDGGEGC